MYFTLRFTLFALAYTAAAQRPTTGNSTMSGRGGSNQTGVNRGQGSDPQSSMTLDPSVIQQAATSNGLTDPANPDKFAPSLTSSNNFINFCLGSTITNGKQDGKQAEEGSCNPTPMGFVPSKQKMPSVKIKSPLPSQNIPANKPFDIQVATRNLDTGFFSAPMTAYYLAPQQLNKDGFIKGHIHVVIQALAEDDDVPDPTKFAFFKGISTAAVNGVFSATVTDGLPDGRYRLATITSTIGHQIVATPVAGRGSVEDTMYFSVGTGQGGPDGNAIANTGADGSSPKGKKTRRNLEYLYTPIIA